MATILIGPKCLLEGFGLILKPDLRRFFMIPILLNIVVFSILSWLSIYWFSDFMDLTIPKGESILITFVRTIFWLFFAASVLLIIFFSFSMVTNLIASPFNGLLSEKVETYLTGNKPKESERFLDIAAGILPSFLNELRKISYFFVIGSIILIISFIPILNIIAPFIWFIFGSQMQYIEYLSYPMENHGLYLKEIRKLAAKRRLLCFSFGLSVMCMTMIPLINFLVMPASVAGATTMWIRHWKKSISSV